MEGCFLHLFDSGLHCRGLFDTESGIPMNEEIEQIIDELTAPGPEDSVLRFQIDVDWADYRIRAWLAREYPTIQLMYSERNDDDTLNVTVNGPIEDLRVLQAEMGGAILK